MKRLILAAMAVVTLGAAGAFAQSLSHSAPPGGSGGTSSSDARSSMSNND